MTSVFATIVDWAALGRVGVISLAATLVLVSLYSAAVVATAARGADGSESVGATRRGLGYALFGLFALAIAAGLYVIFGMKS